MELIHSLVLVRANEMQGVGEGGVPDAIKATFVGCDFISLNTHRTMPSTYETLDWDAEAKRIAAAFGAQGDLEWCDIINGGKVLHHRQARIFAVSLPFDFILKVDYKPTIRQFAVMRKPRQWSCLDVQWDGSLLNVSSVNTCALPLTKGLFYLGLLSPEVEEALQVSISAHQKLEWTLEYDVSI